VFEVLGYAGILDMEALWVTSQGDVATDALGQRLAARSASLPLQDFSTMSTAKKPTIGHP
jgi:hypothetical protein